IDRFDFSSAYSYKSSKHRLYRNHWLDCDCSGLSGFSTNRCLDFESGTIVLDYTNSGLCRYFNWFFLEKFAKMGWKALVVGMCVLLGTYIGSAVIAEIVLRIQGII